MFFPERAKARSVWQSRRNLAGSESVSQLFVAIHLCAIPVRELLDKGLKKRGDKLRIVLPLEALIAGEILPAPFLFSELVLAGVVRLSNP